MSKQTIFKFVAGVCKYLPTRKIPRLTKMYTARILGIKDFSLNSGERQTSESLDGIRVDHTARYQVAIDFLQKHYNNTPIKGYDVFCGIGYGAFMLSQAMQNVALEAIDGSDEAIKLAQKHYQTGRITFEQKIFPFDIPTANADFFISMESIEHIEDDKLFFDMICKALKPNGILILSTPNEERWKRDVNNVHFHYRHYFPNKFIEWASSLNFKLLHFYGQDIYKLNSRGRITTCVVDKDMAMHEGYEGQNCVFIFQKIK